MPILPNHQARNLCEGMGPGTERLPVDAWQFAKVAFSWHSGSARERQFAEIYYRDPGSMGWCIGQIRRDHEGNTCMLSCYKFNMGVELGCQFLACLLLAGWN